MTKMRQWRKEKENSYDINDLDAGQDRMLLLGTSPRGSCQYSGGWRLLRRLELSVHSPKVHFLLFLIGNCAALHCTHLVAYGVTRGR